ncbi:hypothetical protein QPK87_04015 [Kamptonema cortianum]|nr:hypothetical protein [Kamptonema cortianum]MDL5048044.1 hypothetical protein [Oscillatoria amoena NRMC-F 0135]
MSENISPSLSRPLTPSERESLVTWAHEGFLKLSGSEDAHLVASVEDVQKAAKHHGMKFNPREDATYETSN